MISLGLSVHLEEGVVDGGMGSGGTAMVRWGCVVWSSVVGSSVMGSSVVGSSVVWSSLVWSSVVGNSVVGGRVGWPLSMRSVVGGAGAIVGLARVGYVCDVARVCIIHMVGHSLLGNSTHFTSQSFYPVCMII